MLTTGLEDGGRAWNQRPPGAEAPGDLPRRLPHCLDLDRPPEIPADADIAKLGLALAAAVRGDLYELMASAQ
jgi:hypothetical protein